MNITNIIKKHKIDKKANVVGWSNELKPKIVGGKETEVKAIRIYVSKKLPIEELKAKDIIPSMVNGVLTDVVEVGHLKALSVDKTDFFRPVILGISVGNYNITAGTLGYIFEDANNNLYFASNSHVFVDDPSLPPEKVTEKRILQPGPYDIQNHLWIKIDPKFVIGEYYWHKQIKPYGETSTCPIAKIITKLYNFFAEIFGAKTRLVALTEEDNYVDFAVATIKAPYEIKFPNLDVTNKKFVGLLFAGSDQSTIICKVKHIIELGYKPHNIDVAEVKDGDVLWKEGRTTCMTSGKVIDSSATVMVDYGHFTARFTDVIIAEAMSKPGDSGSSVFI